MKIYLTKDSTIDLNISRAVKFLNSKCNFAQFEELSLSYQAPDKRNKKVARENLPVKSKKNAKHNWGNEAVSVFISYSHKDEKDRLKLEDHLKILQRLGIINTWSDRKISAGTEWKDKIDENLNFLQALPVDGKPIQK